MKTVGKQLQDARAAKGWSPELAARETKIRVDRLHDLEADDYSNFSSPTYARGFVRTYARALGLDEYKILRQLDNKLPEDDNATFVNDSGVPYMPEPSQVRKPLELGRGAYIAGGVGAAVLLLIGFILIQSYRAGYFASTPVATPAVPATNALPIAPESETARALPADSNAAPVPIPVENQPLAAAPVSAPAVAPPGATTNAAPPRAMPVNLADLTPASNAPAATPSTVAPPSTTGTSPAVATPLTTATPTPPVAAVPAAPISGPATTAAPIAPATDAAPTVAATPEPATTTTTTTLSPIATNAPAIDVTTAAPTSTTVPTTTTTPPRALPVDLSALNNPPAADTTAAPAPETTPTPAVHSLSARDSNSRPNVNLAAAKAATDSLIASTAPTAAPPPVAAPTSPAPVSAQTSPELASTASAAPSSLGPPSASPQEQPPAAPDSTAALTGAPAAGDAAPTTSAAPVASSSGTFHGQRLVLTASHDSFVRVIALDGPDAGQVRYSSTLRGGESISFNDRKYSINVANPSAVDIALDGINYGPHSDNSEPDTFTVESHTP